MWPTRWSPRSPGAQTTEGRALRKVLPRTSVADAAGMLAAVIRHTEIDDIHTRSCTTPSSVTVPTALALAREHSDTTIPTRWRARSGSAPS